MNEQKVKFVILKTGEIKMEVLGGDGENCIIATQEIEQHLLSDGSTKKSDEGKKPEFYNGGTSTFDFVNNGDSGF